MEPADKYREFLRLLAPTLRQYGFKGGGQNYCLRSNDNWGLINFQKSVSTNAQRVRFTVNLGTVSGRLRRLFPESWYRDKPIIDDCHWRERLDSLLPSRDETWWEIDAQTSMDALLQEFKAHLQNVAIPAIQKHIHDEALRDLWLHDRGGIISDHQRLAYLAVLLKILGPGDALEEVLQNIKRQSHRSGILVRAQGVLAELDQRQG